MTYGQLVLLAFILVMIRVTSAAAQMPSLPRGGDASLKDPFRSPRQGAVAPVKTLPPPPAPALAATSLLIAGSNSTATLRGSHRLLVIGIGDWVDGWRVTAIGEGGVTLQFGSTSHGTMTQLPIEKYWRVKEANVNGSAATTKEDHGNAAISGPVLPGGDLPLLPQTTIPQPQSHAVPSPGGEAAQPRSAASFPYPMPSAAPRLTPNP